MYTLIDNVQTHPVSTACAYTNTISLLNTSLFVGTEHNRMLTYESRLPSRTSVSYCSKAHK